MRLSRAQLSLFPEPEDPWAIAPEEFDRRLTEARGVARQLYRWVKRTVLASEPWPRSLAVQHPWLEEE